MTNAACEPSTPIRSAEQATGDVRLSSIATVRSPKTAPFAPGELPEDAILKSEAAPTAPESSVPEQPSDQRPSPGAEPPPHFGEETAQPVPESLVPAIPPTLTPPAAAWASPYGVGAGTQPIHPPSPSPYEFNRRSLPSAGGYSGPILKETLEREHPASPSLRDSYLAHATYGTHPVPAPQHPWVVPSPSVAHSSASRAPNYDTEAMPLQVTYYLHDSSVFFDCEYVTKAVPGRILWKLLNVLVSEGRSDFTNRELRHEPSLRLPAARDNLETRLYLLRKRLNSRFSFASIEKTGRGQFRLRLRRTPNLRTIG